MEFCEGKYKAWESQFETWADFRLERPDLRPESPDLRPERPDQNNQTDKRTKVPCVLQDFVPFGAAAQKERRRGRKRERK